MEPDNNSPFLNSLPKKDPFVVPEGFFERFPEMIAESVAERPSYLQRLLAGLLMPRISPRLALGSVLTVLALGLVFWLNEPAKDAVIPSAMTHQTAVEPTDWQDAELYVLLEEGPDIWEGVSGSISTSELENYLETEDLDLELLNELL